MSTTDAPKPIRVMTVDDHPLLREGIAAIVELQADMLIVGEAANGVEAITAFGNLRPDVMLMDLQMPVMGGLDAIVGDPQGGAAGAHHRPDHL